MFSYLVMVTMSQQKMLIMANICTSEKEKLSLAPNTFESEWAQGWHALEEMEVNQKEALHG